MLKIEKSVLVQVDGEDFHTLSNVCEAARVYLKDRQDIRFPKWSGQFGSEEVKRMEEFMQRVFDA